MPQRQRNELSWEEVTQLLDVFTKFEMDVYDMASGAKLGPATLETIKGGFVVEC